MLIILN